MLEMHVDVFLVGGLRGVDTSTDLSVLLDLTGWGG